MFKQKKLINKNNTLVKRINLMPLLRQRNYKQKDSCNQ